MGIETFVNQYVNLYNPNRSNVEGFASKKKLDKFGNETEEYEETGDNKSKLVFFLWLVIIIYAIYLSWKCNGKKLELIHFLFALMCAPIYILYQLATNGLAC
jgi:hypothetical protein